MPNVRARTYCGLSEVQKKTVKYKRPEWVLWGFDNWYHQGEKYANMCMECTWEEETESGPSSIWHCPDCGGKIYTRSIDDEPSYVGDVEGGSDERLDWRADTSLSSYGRRAPGTLRERSPGTS